MYHQGIMDVQSLERPERLSPNQIHEQIMYWLSEGRRMPFIPYPAITYTFFRAAVRHEQPEMYSLYASTSITSGGAVLPRDDGAEVPFAEGMRRNEQYAVELMQAVIDGNSDIVTEMSHVNPVFVGKVPIYHFEYMGQETVTDRYWQQDEYLQYWFAVITGIEAAKVEGESDEDHWQRTYEASRSLFNTHSELCSDDIEQMNDRNAPEEQRAAAYQHFTEVFVALVNEMHEQGAITVKPVEYLLGLIDNERSFGGRSEKQLGDVLGAKALQVILSGADWQRTPLGSMADDLSHHGAVFAAPAGQIRLALARKLGVVIDPEPLNIEEKATLASEPQRRRDESAASFEDALRSTIHGGETQEAMDLLSRLRDIAIEVDNDKRHIFHSVMISEVLRPGSVDINAIPSVEPNDLTDRVATSIYYLRHPNESWR